MPKINKLRIVGLKYNGQAKQYNDLTFDFHNEKEATNTLISFMNGGGKGVLLHTLFQIIRPGSNWGEKDNRLYQQFFYNEREKFLPYTFHIVIEWELDGSERRSFLTGGIFTAERRASSSNEMTQPIIVPRFQFYSKEYPYGMDELERVPLYKNGEAQSFETLKDYLESNNFEVYTNERTHQNKLLTYGIDRKDWDIIKDINKSEGGVGKYFEQAEDDESLFRKKIIPLLSNVLKKDDGKSNDLVEIFQSQASIAKDLPVLIKREQAHAEFLECVHPLEEKIKDGLEKQRTLLFHQTEGKRYYSALEHLIALEKEAALSIENEIQLLEKEFSRYRFEQDNLEYAYLVREINNVENKLKEKQAQSSRLLILIESSKKREKDIHSSILYKEWQTLDEKVSHYQTLLQKLEESEDLKDIRDRIEELKTESEEKCEAIMDVIQTHQASYSSYMNALKCEEEKWLKKNEKAIVESSLLGREILSLELSIQTHEDNRENLISKYGEGVRYALDAMIRSYNEKWTEFAGEKENHLEKEQKYQKALQTLSTNTGSYTQELFQLQRVKQELGTKLITQEKEETMFRQLLVVILQEEIEALSNLILLKVSEQLDKTLQKCLDDLSHIERNLWLSQMNQTLNDQEYWIANADLKEMKDALDRQVDVYYGTEFLKGLNREDRETYHNRFPLLPYGLVLSRKSYQKIDFSRIKTSVQQSPVLFFLSEEMGVNPSSSLLVWTGDEKGLILDEKELDKWKKKEDDERQTLEEERISLTKTEVAIRKAIRSLHILQSGSLAADIEKQLDVTDDDIKETEHRLRLTKEEESMVQRKLKDNERLQREIEQQLIRCQETVNTLRKYKGEESLYREDLSMLTEAKEQKEVQEERVKEAKREIKRFKSEIELWKTTYFRWQAEIEGDLKMLSVLKAGLVFPMLPESENTSLEVPLLPKDICRDALHIFAEFEYLQQTKESKNNEILSLQKDLHYHQENRNKEEVTLNKLYPDWRKRLVRTEPLDVLYKLHEEIQDELCRHTKTYGILNEELISLKTTITAKSDEKRRLNDKLYQLHGKSGVELSPENDIETLKAAVKASLKRVHQDRLETISLKDEVIRAINTYENNRNLLQGAVGDMGEIFEQSDLVSLKQQSQITVIKWIEQHRYLNEENKKKEQRVSLELTKLKNAIVEKPWEPQFKIHVLRSFDKLQGMDLEHIYMTIEGMKRFSVKSLEELEKEKERAEKAQSYWSNRAAMKVMSLTDMIQTMIKKMRFSNEHGSFPLVMLKDEDMLPKKTEDVEHLLKDHFVVALEHITSHFESIDQEDATLQKEIERLVGDERILYVALRHRYPILLVYNMQTDNAFSYRRPKKEHYSDWKTINNGSDTKSDGSGGQKLAARMIIMMMLLSTKHVIDNKWTTLVVDNPFGQAASEHVLDPIFAVAEKLKFQLIVVTPPELVKTDISRRFPVYYKLDFRKEKGKDVITQSVQQSFRTELSV
jgi:uncharacterized protein YktB (UPF0637 family)